MARRKILPTLAKIIKEEYEIIKLLNIKTIQGEPIVLINDWVNNIMFSCTSNSSKLLT